MRSQDPARLRALTHGRLRLHPDQFEGQDRVGLFRRGAAVLHMRHHSVPGGLHPARGPVWVPCSVSGRSHGQLKDGDYFGDLSVMLGEKRTASVKALMYCDMFVMTKTDFNSIKLEYAEFRGVLGRVSSERTDRMAALVLDGVIL